MSKQGSVYQKGGGGTNFEQTVQTAFLTSLIIGGKAPINEDNSIIEIALQTTNRGWVTDDILVIAKSLLGDHNILIQIKTDISFTTGSKVFKEVLEAFWKDYTNTNFDKKKDKLFVIKNGLTKGERNHVKSIFNWARTHSTFSDFLSEVNRIKAKKETYETFYSIINEINNGVPVPHNDVWQFLKCLDVIEYDFTNQNSKDETNVLNLIKLSKTGDKSEKDIWNILQSIIAKANKDGGSFTTESIKDEGFYKFFDISKVTSHFDSILKLNSDSNVILDPIKNTIGDIHLDRIEIKENLTQSINDSQITFVTGKPGVGKSAIIKEVISKNFQQSTAFAFRADQFNEPHLANVFNKQGVNVSLEDIFSTISLIPNKILFIDSIEKLLETDPESAFKQLIGLLNKYSDIKIIGASRNYAIDLILRKFGISEDKINIIEIPLLNDDEIEIITSIYPIIKEFLQNTKSEDLLKSPKYVDFIIKALLKTDNNLNSNSIIELKNNLWESLVLDSTNTIGGLPLKRETAFMEIAIKRAKEMALFTKPINADPEAIQLLEKDEIIFQEKNKRRYSPSHDILEDWALVRYVSDIHEESSNVGEFYANLGNEPAIRRAFRLWIEDLLIDNKENVLEIIAETLVDISIENYWADEIMVSVFKSYDSRIYFEYFEKELLNNKNEFHLLKRSIHIIRTTCKESKTIAGDKAMLIPIGSGWFELISFIKENIEKLEQLRFQILYLLKEWENKLLSNNIELEELNNVKFVVLFYLRELENSNEFWKDKFEDSIHGILIHLIFSISSVANSEIEKICDKAHNTENIEQSYSLSNFYEKFIDKIILGIGNHNLIREMPDLVTKTVWDKWKFIEQKPPEGSISGLMGGSSLDEDECWGIEDYIDDLPSGIYKTPIYFLLKYHPKKGIKFLVEFINYSVDFYVNADCSYKHKIESIEIEFIEGENRTIWAGNELWQIYRGTSVTSYTLESLLMSLEKYLLKCADDESELCIENIRYIYDYIFKHTNNVAPIAVLTSVAIAYPNSVGQEFIPILKVKEFYKFDLSRSLNEIQALAPYDFKIPFAQEERGKQNQLSHRKKYIRGLSDFIVDYQFTNGKLNQEIFEAFDKLKELSNTNEDVIWNKTLIEIDIRNYSVGEYDEEKKGFLIQPQYDKNVSSFMVEGEETREQSNTSSKYANILLEAYKNNKSVKIEIWNSIYKYYLQKDRFDTIMDRPITLAVVGLREFHSVLPEEQLNWSKSIIINTIKTIIANSLEPYNISFPSFSIVEKSIVLNSFHLLLKNAADNENKYAITLFLATLLYGTQNHETSEFTKYYREVFTKQYAKESKIIWEVLLEYSKTNFEKKISRDFDEIFNALAKLYDTKVDNNNNIENHELIISNFEVHHLVTLLLITPFDTEDVDYNSYIRLFTKFTLEDIQNDRRSYHRRKQNQRAIHYTYIETIKSYLIELLMEAKQDFSTQIIDIVTAPIIDNKIGYSLSLDNDLYKFTYYIFRTILSNVDKKVYHYKGEIILNETYNRFWFLWEYLFEKIKESKTEYFVDLLLLSLEWNEDAIHWRPLEHRKEFYNKVVNEFGDNNIKILIHVFSTIGENTFLPYGIKTLVEILKRNNVELYQLTSPSAIRLVKRLYLNNITTIKRNKSLMNDYIFILDNMVDYGISEAYFIRENVISYKK